jgi:hypothetical protein
MADEVKTEAEVEVPAPAKPKKPRKQRAKKAKKELADVELELDEDEADEELPEHYVLIDGKTVKLNGSDVMLKVLSIEQQKEYGITSVLGEMGKKCKNPVVLTFKNAKLADAFFDMCLYAEKEQEELIIDGKKTEWHWA